MTQDQTDLAPRRARILERRAARTRRSKWLGRLLFSLSGMGLLLLLRTNPGIVEDAVAVAYGAPVQSEAATAQADGQAGHMPKDVVPVRRGGALPQAHANGSDTKAQADEVAQTLRNLSPGG